MSVLSNFKIVPQGAASNLCWACVGWGVATYYDQRAGLPPRWSSVCDYVMAVFNANDGIPPDSSRCCDGQRLFSPDCNQPRFLPDALRVSRNRGSVRDGTLKFEEIQAEIDANHPVGIEIESSTGSHVIAIYGYDNSDGQKVMVGDPAPDAPSGVLVSYDELCTNYRHMGGVWEQSYLTFPG
jgi:hypothetical protein